MIGTTIGGISRKPTQFPRIFHKIRAVYLKAEEKGVNSRKISQTDMNFTIKTVTTQKNSGIFLPAGHSCPFLRLVKNSNYEMSFNKISCINYRRSFIFFLPNVSVFSLSQNLLKQANRSQVSLEYVQAHISQEHQSKRKEG
jgi:hypothetical protein